MWLRIHWLPAAGLSLSSSRGSGETPRLTAAATRLLSECVTASGLPRAHATAPAPLHRASWAQQASTVQPILQMERLSWREVPQLGTLTLGTLWSGYLYYFIMCLLLGKLRHKEVCVCVCASI